MSRPGPPVSAVSDWITANSSAGGSRSITLLTSTTMLPPQMIPCLLTVAAGARPR